MEKLEKTITALTIGIRYQKSFRVADITGEIIDTILLDKNSPFDHKLFPRIEVNSAWEQTLYNPETFEYLRINTDDIILSLAVDDNFSQKFNFLHSKVIPFYEGTLFTRHDINNIIRVGIIYSHKLDRSQEFSNKISAIAENKINDPENISISFSKKHVTSEALIRKNVNDYKNTIFSFREMKENLICDLDYQYFYDPAIEDLRDGKLKDIISQSNTYRTDNYYEWLKNYVKEQKSK